MYVEICILWLELEIQVVSQAELQEEPWREDNRDSDDVPQLRRPTASTRRQQETAVVAEDAPYMDDAAEEVFQHAEEVFDDAKGFPSGSCDPSMMTAYADHVAVIVWN